MHPGAGRWCFHSHFPCCLCPLYSDWLGEFRAKFLNLRDTTPSPQRQELIDAVILSPVSVIAQGEQVESGGRGCAWARGGGRGDLKRAPVVSDILTPAQMVEECDLRVWDNGVIIGMRQTRQVSNKNKISTMPSRNMQNNYEQRSPRKPSNRAAP